MFGVVGRPAVAGLLAVALAGTFPGVGAASAADPDPIRDWPRTEVAPGVALYQGEVRGRPGAELPQAVRT